MEVLMVIYKPSLDELGGVFNAVVAARAEGVPARVRLWHNDGGLQATPGLEALVEQHRSHGLPIEVLGGDDNLGFGKGMNALMQTATASHVLVLNQDAIPEPGALALLWQTASTDADKVAAWEMRQIP